MTILLHTLLWLLVNNSTTRVTVIIGVRAELKKAAKDKAGKTPWDYAKDNDALKSTDVYKRLKE